ncbi:MAG: hypothetical protein GF421_12455 [Candidatus Aminicenantes bacterium]|nr:hypothetical protein [Candidatus Aminicenantes bacterium]
MNKDKKIQEISRCSDKELAKKVNRIAKAVQSNKIICITESGRFAYELHDLKTKFRIIATTASPKAYEAMREDGIETIRLPLHAVDKYRQIRHVLSVVLKAKKISVGELVVCAVGNNVYPGEGNLIVVAQIEENLKDLAITDLLKLTNGIRPKALEATIAVACQIGRAARRGKRLGTILMLGDSEKVLRGSRQLIPNPFKNLDESKRMITDSSIHDAVIELSKLDGALVLRGDGFIKTVGVFLSAGEVKMDLPSGLGARHSSAAAVTARTSATGVVVSATDGNVRVFSKGQMALRIDPDIEHGPINLR